MTFKKTFLPAVILAVICLVCALALALTNTLTQEKIAQTERERYLSSVKEVLPEGVTLEEVATEGVEGFLGKNENGALVGYAIKTSAKGYGGDVLCVVGFDASGTLIGLSVSAPDETPGLGSNVQKSAFREQFLGADTAPVLGEALDGVTGGFDFLTVCRPDIFVKGLDRLLDAAAELRDNGYSFKWAVVGVGADQRFLSMLSEKKLDGYVIPFVATENPYPLLFCLAYSHGCEITLSILNRNY